MKNMDLQIFAEPNVPSNPITPEINYETEAFINTSPAEGQPTWASLANLTTNMAQSLNEVIQQLTYYADKGWGSSEVTGAQLTLTLTGSVKPGDDACDYILSDDVMYGLGEKRKTHMKLQKGKKIIIWPITLANIIIGNITNILRNLIDFIRNIFTGNWRGAWENVKQIFSNAVSGLATIFKAPINAIVDGWNGLAGNLSKVNVDVEVDCSALVRVCCLYAGIQVGDFNTASELETLRKTGAFEILKDDKRCKESTYLKRGDILVTRTKGHTVVVLDNGSGVTSASKSTRAYVVGQVYTTQVDDLSVRTGPGTNNPEKSYAELSSNAQQHAHDNGRLKKGTHVTCKDVREVGNDIWIKIPSGWIAAYYGGKKYVG